MCAIIQTVGLEKTSPIIYLLRHTYIKHASEHLTFDNDDAGNFQLSQEQIVFQNFNCVLSIV